MYDHTFLDISLLEPVYTHWISTSPPGEGYSSGPRDPGFHLRQLWCDWGELWGPHCLRSRRTQKLRVS